MYLIVVFPWLQKLCFHGYRSCVSMVTEVVFPWLQETL